MATGRTILFDRRRCCPVEATIHFSLPPGRILDTERVWGPHRWSATRRLLDAGRLQEIPQHGHWDWSRKVGNLGLAGYQCVGVECDGEMQGMMMLATVGHDARLPASGGKPIVYVDYLETAPWNLRPFVEEPRYGSVGAGLIRAAVEVSNELMYNGRVGLHSLPQSESFYERRCGFTTLGPDPDYLALIYFEFTAENAVAFLRQGESQ